MTYRGALRCAAREHFGEGVAFGLRFLDHVWALLVIPPVRSDRLAPRLGIAILSSTNGACDRVYILYVRNQPLNRTLE